jgi:hypothetical protein
MTASTTMTEPTAAPEPVASTTWQIDPIHSTAEFAVRHMKVTTVKGHICAVADSVRPFTTPHGTGLLREAAEVRDERERARMIRDVLLARREARALLDPIRTHGRPKVKHYVTHSAARRAPPAARVTP